MKILLLNPPIRENDLPRIFPTGLGIIASVLVKDGHHVDVVDVNGLRWNKERVKAEIRRPYDLIGIGGLVTTYGYVQWLIDEIKSYNPTVPVVVGNSVASSIPYLLLNRTKADVAVLREGEETIIELVDTIEKHGLMEENLKGIQGIWYKIDGKIHSNKERQPIKDLDSLPFPSWDLFPMETYLRNSIFLESKPIYHSSLRDINVISSRGCPYSCLFCYHYQFKGYRFRSPDNVLQEIAILKDKYKVNFICFVDDNFIANRKRVLEFCEKYKKEKLDMDWFCFGRVNNVDPLLLSTMRSAGCVWLGYGIESGSQKMLDILHKGVRVDQAKKAIQMTREAKMIVGYTLMLGSPGETDETVEDTVKFCKELHLSPKFFITTPYPGTQLYQMALERNLIANEEEYVKTLSDATELRVNLTEWSDEELSAVIQNAEKRTKVNLLRTAYFFYKDHGIKMFLRMLKYFGLPGLFDLLRNSFGKRHKLPK